MPRSRPFLVGCLAALTLTVTACGNITTGEAGGEAAPPGITDSTIKLGTSMPVTGVAQLAGQGLEAGLRIAAEEINANGGIGGRQIELVVLDDGFKPDRLVANVQRLVSQEQVYALVAPSGSQALAGTYATLAQTGTPMWGPVSPPDPEQREVFLLGATRTVQARVALDHFADLGANRIAFIGQENDLGKEGNAALDQQVPRNPGMEVVARAGVQQGSTDVASAVNAVIDARPDALLVSTDNNQLALILKQLRSRGVDIPVAADQGAGGTGAQSTVGPAGEAAEGLVGAFQVDVVSTDNPEVEHWRTLAQAYDGPEATSGFSLQTYGYLKAFAEIIERAGDDVSHAHFAATAEKLAEDPIDLGSMPQIECGPLPGGHTCVQQAGLAEFRDGAWQVLKPFTAPR
ncbi:ABC transporter substrate-binding protein [Pseudonocardia parietis]|uniref:Branched-chain amino acid transport system substrate-binding protein n=1 Tax=Pseudonocardia parietis TaxID=570936 RepID=A0ABS4VZM2_9PSEU|nr:ABC transporter substrate-binding protein [Pseudonocardia parietis]MBP2369404.1 branched-chain amino acid transport system substrate-binding protein [Pseudonocardia parietis]